MIIRTENELDTLIKELESVDKFAFDTEYVPYGYPDLHLTGCSFSTDGKTGYYLPIGHNTGEVQLPLELVIDKLKPILENQSKTIICHNVQAEIKIMWLQGIYLHDSEYYNQIMKPFKPKQVDMFNSTNDNYPKIDYSKDGVFKYNPPVREKHLWDTMVASWLLFTDRPEGHGLDDLAEKFFNVKVVRLTEIAKKEYCPRLGVKPNKYTRVLRVDKVPINIMGKYAIEDAVYTYRLYELFEPKLREEGMEKIFWELEMPFVKVLSEMEILGAPMNKKLLDEYGTKIKEAMDTAERKAYDCRPNKEPFNMDSPKQLNEVLFEELKIKPIGEPGKSGYYSTNREVLEDLQWRYQYFLAGKDKTGDRCEIASHILKYREVSKLYGTYVEGMGAKLKADGRLHGNFMRTGARTGRISSSDPNLQNLPNNSVYPIRECFYAPTKEYAEKHGIPMIEPIDWVFGTLDYSQIELRVLAHLSQDENMINVFCNDGDIHSRTAHGCFHLDCPVEEVKEKYPDKRSNAKSVNFGVVYGISGMSLAKDINSNLDNPEEFISSEEGDMLVEGFFRTYPNVPKFIDYVHRRASKEGRIRTITGRYRHLPNMKLRPWEIKNRREQRIAFMKKSKAERQSQNSIVQGSASDIMAIAMRNIRNSFMESGEWFTSMQMIIQVHDEINCLFKKGKEEEHFNRCKDIMENSVELRVPIKADGELGSNWWEVG